MFSLRCILVTSFIIYFVTQNQTTQGKELIWLHNFYIKSFKVPLGQGFVLQ